MLGKKHPFASYSAAKHLKAANLRLQSYDKNQLTFFINTARASTLALAIIFTIQVPLQKLPFLLRYTIPFLEQRILVSIGTETIANEPKLVKLFRELKSTLYAIP